MEKDVPVRNGRAFQKVRVVFGMTAIACAAGVIVASRDLTAAAVAFAIMYPGALSLVAVGLPMAGRWGLWVVVFGAVVHVLVLGVFIAMWKSGDPSRILAWLRFALAVYGLVFCGICGVAACGWVTFLRQRRGGPAESGGDKQRGG